MVQRASGQNSVQAITPLANLGNLYFQQAQRQSANPTLQKSLLGKGGDGVAAGSLHCRGEFQGHGRQSFDSASGAGSGSVRGAEIY